MSTFSLRETHNCSNLSFRERIRGKLTLNQMGTVQKDIQNQCSKLTRRLRSFRDVQVVVMPFVSDLVAVLPTCEIEKEILYLLSDVPESERATRGVTELANMEEKFREAELYDAVEAVWAAAKAYSIPHVEKRDNTRGTNAGLRSTLQLKRIEMERDCCIADFNRTHEALIRLGWANSAEIPTLSLSDTRRRSTFQVRKLDDSRRTDGLLFNLVIVAEQDDLVREMSDVEAMGEEVTAGTGSVRRARGAHAVSIELSKLTIVSGPRKTVPKEKKKEVQESEDGWIWKPKLTFGAKGNTEAELAFYEEESKAHNHLGIVVMN